MDEQSPASGDAEGPPGFERITPTRHFIHVTIPDPEAQPLVMSVREAMDYIPRPRTWHCRAGSCSEHGTGRSELDALDKLVVHAGECRAVA